MTIPNFHGGFNASSNDSITYNLLHNNNHVLVPDTSVVTPNRELDDLLTQIPSESMYNIVDLKGARIEWKTEDSTLNSVREWIRSESIVGAAAGKRPDREDPPASTPPRRADTLGDTAMDAPLEGAPGADLDGSPVMVSPTGSAKTRRHE